MMKDILTHSRQAFCQWSCAVFWSNVDVRTISTSHSIQVIHVFFFWLLRYYAAIILKPWLPYDCHKNLQIVEIKWIIERNPVNEMLSFDRTRNLHNESHFSSGFSLTKHWPCQKITSNASTLSSYSRQSKVIKMEWKKIFRTSIVITVIYVSWQGFSVFLRILENNCFHCFLFYCT